MKAYFERIIIVLTLLGLLTTIHLWVMSERGFDRGCIGISADTEFDETFNCKMVMESDMSSMMGISNVFWGMMFYAFLTILNLLVYYTYDKMQRVIRTVRLFNITLGICYSVVLSSYQVFWIQQLCALCLTSAIILFLLFVTSIFYWKVHPLKLTVPHAHLWYFSSALVIVMFLAVSDILYFNSLDKGGSFAKILSIDFESIFAELSPPKKDTDTDKKVDCQYNDDKAPIPNYVDLITNIDVRVGNGDSGVTIIEYFDPSCYHCKELHDVIMQAKEMFGDDAIFVFKPIPMWRHSTIQIQALHIAAEEDLFFEMLRKQFIFQSPSTGLNLKEIIEIAKDIGMDEISLAKRIIRGDYLHYIMSQYKNTRDNKITSFPTVLINGRTVATKSITTECIGEFFGEIE